MGEIERDERREEEDEGDRRREEETTSDLRFLAKLMTLFRDWRCKESLEPLVAREITVAPRRIVA